MTYFFFLIWQIAGFLSAVPEPAPKIWTLDEARAWQAKQPWVVGCNFIPSSAVNELEMWQAESFDTGTINRELGWAHQIGMNAVRVFLHNIPWQQDSVGFCQRIDRYLALAQRNRIQTIFVLFDDCWNEDPRPGKQPAPKPGIHNSGWVQCPGKRIHDDPGSWGPLQDYVRGILSAYKKDNRILCWDLYNEPGNSNYGSQSLPLLKKVFDWAWSVRPDQPLTTGIWNDDAAFNDWELGHVDILSFHNYNIAQNLETEIIRLEKSGRPLICTEYMARPLGSRFQSHLPIFKKYRVGAMNWGLVSGKTNTIYQWSKPVPNGSEPNIWFHDIFRKDGTPYDPDEIRFIRQITETK
jgi:hypothetical protein